jgi:hypothetical protein
MTVHLACQLRRTNIENARFKFRVAEVRRPDIDTRDLGDRGMRAQPGQQSAREVRAGAGNKDFHQRIAGLRIS